jgi:hypothetical protein
MAMLVRSRVWLLDWFDTIDVWYLPGQLPGPNQFLSWDKSVQEFLPLLMNTLVTLHNETVGYIQTVSLRWALQREGKLEFNSNLRLFSRARSAAANSWYLNL